MKRPGIALAAAAVLAMAPRLVVVMLDGDGVSVEVALRAWLIGTSGAASALVLTGGAAYTASVLARTPVHRRLLAVLWVLVLACIVCIGAPLLVAGLQHRELEQVLSPAWVSALWAVLCIAAPEIGAAACMVADRAVHAERETVAGLEAELEEVARERNRLRGQVDRLREEASSPSPAFACSDCGRNFGSQKALNAHGQHCKGRA